MLKKPLDLTAWPRDPRSGPIDSATTDGGYVYVQDAQGTGFIVPDGPHMHPRVLGGAQSAMYAGDLTVYNRVVSDVTKLSGTFQFDDPDGLPAVADQIERQGIAVASGGVRLFPLDGSRPRTLR